MLAFTHTQTCLQQRRLQPPSHQKQLCARKGRLHTPSLHSNDKGFFVQRALPSHSDIEPAHPNNNAHVPHSVPEVLQAHPTQGLPQIARLTKACALIGVCFAALGTAAAKAVTPPPQSQQVSATVTSAASLARPSNAELVKYKVLQAYTLPGSGKLLALLTITLPITIVGAWFYRNASGEDWTTSIVRTYYVLNKVPSQIAGENRAWASFILNVIHLISIGTFAVLVGVFTSEIAGGIKQMRSGNFTLPESKHTVVLGWHDKQSVTLLREMVESQANVATKGTIPFPIVVLTEYTKKSVVDEQIRNELGELFQSVIMTRQGSPAKPQDLERVEAGRASVCIWMMPSKELSEQVNPQASLASSLTCLQAIRAADSPPMKLLILEKGGGQQASAWTDTPPGRLATARIAATNTQVTKLRDVSELGIKAQVALQPHLSEVFEQLFLQERGLYKLHTSSHPELAHRTFEQARKAFPKATLVGLVDSVTGGSKLTPPDSYVLSESDHLLLLTGNTANLRPNFSSVEYREAVGRGAGNTLTTTTSTPELPPPKSVVVLGYGKAIDGIATSLKEFCSPGSQVTLVVPHGASTAKGLLQKFHGKKVNGVKFTVVEGNMFSNTFLRNAGGVATADSIILAEPDECREVDSDNQVVAAILQLQASLLEEDTGVDQQRSPLHVVSCVSNDKMKGVLEKLVATTPTSCTERRLELNLISSEDLLSGLLTQVAADPLLAGVFEELLNNAAGAEVYIKAPHVFGLRPHTMQKWIEVQNAARASGAVVLGTCSADGTVRLGVESNEQGALQLGDRLVVLALD